MTRVHDMGGRFGDGPVIPESENGPVFSEEWHGRALAVTVASDFLGQWNIDIKRHARECLLPKDYSRFSYYEKWIAGLTNLLVEKGVLTPDDLRGSGDSAKHPLAVRALKAEDVVAALSKGGPADRPTSIAAQFVAGQQVRTVRPAANQLVDGGHTRLPIYASGATGKIVRLHGAHVLPDSNAHGLGEAPEPLYAVVFEASELWPNPEHPGDEVVLDLWQSYLEPV